MTAAADDRLHRLLGGAHLAALRKRLRRRFETAEGVSGCFRIGNLAPEEHAALAGLAGRPPRFASSLQIDLAVIDDALRRAGLATSLRSALERLDGPIVDLAAAKQELQSAWSRVAGRSGCPDLQNFLASPVAIGILKRLSGGDPSIAAALCDRVEAVLRCLPAHGLSRAQLAADVLGDAHALDTGRPIATLVLGVLRGAASLTKTQTETSDNNDDQASPEAEKARDVWAGAGVLVNGLARPAAFLNLPVRDEEGWLAGEPGYVSLRRLLRSPPTWAVAGRAVYICENLNLLTIIADSLGENCPAVVCTDGMPAAAQCMLLRQLVSAGAHLLYHGDFDWPGLLVGNTVMRVFGAQPWRFGAADYLAAVRVASLPGHRLKGPEVLASWNEDLTLAMRNHQIGIDEEAVAASLLSDLG
jgi:uncharacterized protein (TIGR02679 family)